MQTCHEKKCCGLVCLQLGLIDMRTASPRTHKPRFVNKSLAVVNYSGKLH